MPSTPPTPALRQALIAAARAELSEGGRSAVSLRAVARRAGVSHGAPAFAFGDRAGLLTAVAAHGYADLARDMDAPGADGREASLVELGQRYVAFAAEHPALYDLMFRPAELRLDDAELRAAQEASLAALARATGEGVPGDATVVAWAFAHGVASLVGLGALPGGGAASGLPDTPPEELVARFGALVSDDRPHP